MADRFLEPFQPGKGESETLMRVGGIPLGLEGSAEQSRRVLEPTLLQSDHTQPAKRPKMASVCPEHGIVELLCLPQPALLVKRGGLLEGLQHTEGDRLQRRCSVQGLVLLVPGTEWLRLFFSANPEERGSQALAN